MSDIIEMYDSENPDVVSGDGAGMSMEDYFSQMSEEQQAVPVRDGDDSFDVEIEDDEPSEEIEVEGEETEEPNEIETINFDPATMQEAVAELNKSEAGFEQMKADLVNRGLPVDELAQMQANYDATGQLTDQQYNRLAEFGHSREFMDSYIRGQQALSQNFVNQFVASVGGINAFQSVVQTLQGSSPKMIGVLENAIANRDLDTAQSIIELAGTVRSKSYGQPAQRTVTARAIPVNATPAIQQEGFGSKQEMVKAMHDPRYQRDAAYTMEVQRKVAYSPW